MILKDIRFHGYHGVAEAEREIGQKYELDVELSCDLSAAGQTDDLTHTINYAKVVELIVNIGTERSFQLIEALAEAVATAILNQFSVEEVRVIAKKLSPPIESVLSYAAVEIHRGK
jgi:7,8-dihydroneopterin aldolase/epimerase/oxygenase